MDKKRFFGSFAAVLWTSALACSVDRRTDESAHASLQKGRGGTNGDSDYCNNAAAPCTTTPNEGDCDRDSQCTGGVQPVCGQNNGARFGAPANFDFCWEAHCENAIQDNGETGVDCGGPCGACVCALPSGDSEYCSPSCPCDGGEGDCDVDADCSPGQGLVCGVNNGDLFGASDDTFDYCWPATCENRVRDNGEVAVDCGGPCGFCNAPPPDAGVPDTGIVDAAAPDTGVPDAGFDGGVADAGDLGVGGSAACLPFGTGNGPIELSVDWYGNSANGGDTLFLRALSSNGRALAYDTNDRQFIPYSRDEFSQPITKLIADLDQHTFATFNQQTGDVAFDASGRYFAQVSNAGTTQISLRDRTTGASEVISRDTTNTTGGNGSSDDPSVSADATRIAFWSTASNLIAGGNNYPAIYVRDRLTNSTIRVSTPLSHPPSAPPGASRISANGQFVAFASSANNLVPGDTNNAVDAFVYDIALETLTRASVNAAGVEANAGIIDLRISGDGREIMFSSEATNLDPADNDGLPNVFVKNLDTGAIDRLPALINNFGEIYMAESGRFVAWAEDFSTVQVFDRVSRTSEYVGMNRVYDAFLISGDGSVVVYQYGSQLFAERVAAAAALAPARPCAPPLSSALADWQWKAAPYYNYARFDYTATWTDGLVVIWAGDHATQEQGLVYEPTMNQLGVLTIPGAPDHGAGHTATWTGDRLFVWGGINNSSLNPGFPALLNPYGGNWTAPTTVNRPLNRHHHSAVWSGTEVLAWGGVRTNVALNTGVRYDPVLDLWTNMSTVGAPSARSDHTAAWTGTEMLIWGPGADGARYSPTTDAWSPMSSVDGVSADCSFWTGTELFVWNGATGGRYDPVNDDWTPVPAGGPLTLGRCVLIQRPGYIVVFGSTAPAAFELASGTWLPISIPELGWGSVGTDEPGPVDMGGGDIYFFPSARLGPN